MCIYEGIIFALILFSPTSSAPHLSFCFPFDEISTFSVFRPILLLILCTVEILLLHRVRIASDAVHLKLLVPSIAAGSIIGRGGEAIAQVQKESGAKVCTVLASMLKAVASTHEHIRSPELHAARQG